MLVKADLTAPRLIGLNLAPPQFQRRQIQQFVQIIARNDGDQLAILPDADAVLMPREGYHPA